MALDKTHWTPRTWGLVVGFLAFSVATLVGIAAGQEPETILTRALIGTVLAAGLAVAAGSLILLDSSPEEEPPFEN